MKVIFETLPSHAKIWVYASDRLITAEHRDVIEKHMNAFCQQWSAHGHALQSSFQLREDYFLILAVDERIASLSGCAIDESVHALHLIGDVIGCDFFDRTKVSFWIEERVIQYPFNQMHTLFKKRILDDATVMFDISVGTKAALESQWKVPVLHSWASKYLIAK